MSPATCLQVLQGAADSAPGFTEALMHELMLVSSQNRQLPTNRASTLLNTMPVARAGEHSPPPVQP